jgi:PAS domain S-box-containing protein
MKDSSKTKQALTEELASLRQRIGELEQSEVERKKIEEALRESEGRLNTLYQESPIPTFTWQKRGDDFFLIDFNRAAVQITDGKAYNLLGKRAEELYQYQPQVLEDMRRCFTEHSVVRRDTLSKHFAPGKSLSVHYAFIPPDLIIVHTEDQTDRKRADEALWESEEKFRTIFDRATDGILIADAQNKNFLQGNATICSMLGYTKEEIESLTIYDIHPQNDISRVLDEFEKLKKGEKPLAEGLPVLRKDGSIFYTDISSTSITFGGIHYLVGIFRDITERKQAEETLKESEKKYRELYNFLPIPVYEMDFEANMTSVNRAIYETFRGTEEDLKKGFKGWQLLSPEDVDKSARNIQRLLEGEKIEGTEYTLMRIDGSAFPAIVISSLIYSNGKPAGIRGAIVDITQRKQAEAALKESENKYRLIAENMTDVISIVDMNMRFTFVSPSVMRLRGFTVEEAMEQPIEQVMTPESLLRAYRTYEEEMQREASGTADPDRIRIIELEEYRKDMSTVWVEVGLSFLRDTEGRPIGMLSLTRDITERKRAEQKLKDTLESLRKAISTTIQVMVSAVETRDPYTAGHQIRSADLARAIASEMGLPQEKIDGIRMAGSIHDIGKLSIPAEILSKPTKLSEIEFKLIMEHARKGYEILKNVESSWPLAEMVYQHHERMDGSGYPRHLKGEDILIEARILAVADVVEAMASHRPYRAALGLDAALEEIKNNRGLLYDSRAADACLKLFHEKGYQIEGN